MAIDIDKIRARKTSLENRGGRENFWRPTDGEHTLRIIPTPDGDPFRDFWFHYNVGDNPGFLSPKKNFGEEDAIDNFVRKLFNEGTEESIKMAKSLMARQRFFSPVLVRGEEDKGVRIWGYGKMVYEQLLNLVLNPEYGDITDAEQGTDLLIHYGKPPGASFPQTKIMPRRRPSALCEDDPARCAELLANIPDVDTLFERKTPEEVSKVLDAYLLDDSDAESNSSETPKYAGEAQTTEIDKAFNELLS